MSFDFRFILDDNQEYVDHGMDFVSGSQIYYPSFQKWVWKARGELLEGSKRAIVGLSRDLGLEVASYFIFQQHKEIAEIMEMKTLRVARKHHGKGLGDFSLALFEDECRKLGFDLVLGDAHSNMHDVRSLMLRHGYTPLVKVCLYEDGLEETVYIKSLRNRKSIFPSLKKILTSN